MAIKAQLKQITGTSAKVAAFVGKKGVLVVDEEALRVHLQDDVTPGGVPLARLDDVPTNANDIAYGDSTVGEKLDDLLYVKIAISGFKTNVATQEKGATVTDVTLSWTLNKTPKSQTLDGVTLAVADRSKTFTGQTITADKTFTLVATDNRDAQASAKAQITFLNGVYYGKGTVGADGVDKAFVAGLTKVLAGSRARTIKVNAGEGEYIFYALPASMGTPTFTSGGFEGGFELIKTFDYENPSGYTESYNVFRSENHSLGDTTVVIG